MGRLNDADRKHVGEAIRYSALVIVHLRQLTRANGEGTERMAQYLKAALWDLMDGPIGHLAASAAPSSSTRKKNKSGNALIASSRSSIKGR